MTMTDPVADMLTRLRNANSAHHDSVSLPSSKLKTHIAEILKLWFSCYHYYLDCLAYCIAFSVFYLRSVA
jgi:hypothetical protein